MKRGKQDFLKDMEYIDGITIIDRNGKILFSIKFNPWFHPEIVDGEEIIGKNLCEVFTNIDEDISTLFKAMELGRPIHRKKQSVVNIEGTKIVTMNTSLPIKGEGKIIGAIELSKDITKHKDRDTNMNVIQMNSQLFTNTNEMKKYLGPDRARYSLEDIVSNNTKMRELKYFVKKIAKGRSSVFIYGETGTGKELFAHAIHNESSRRDKPFIAQNCAAIPENLLESILFGTTKGSFTGSCDHPGLFELAEGGTLFLDEINSMPIHLQAKLLRVLQDGYIRRLGDRQERNVDVRIITASNMSFKKCIKEGYLREDIYYRLAAMSMLIPPLRERKEDIEILLNFFINKYNKLLEKHIKKVSKDVYNVLINYNWPGNVRELEHVIEYAMNIVDHTADEIEIEHIENMMKVIEEDHTQVNIRPLKEAISEVEKKLIKEAIKKTKGNVSEAARLLEIPRQTLQRKIRSYHII
ncbi:sigma-54 interaction domain-containing protein [Anaeromicrobium sediminis]|uniref:Sigma-54-dependent Fis family transcriptional regulator n=1 Tax=Anaeromicrobium sediminis TaxID=1478221 RepID=A0A267MI32_9FIRM|nr:sigma 54-interacting transcriptional regulator [Anaeromicrobium sediminis]PAB58460.1 sigma-54-dependent Fis family transcriptional regulator [Anaeromicrobium sediminis]